MHTLVTVLGILCILGSLGLGFLMLLAIGMTDGDVPHGWALWSQLWPAYLGLALGALLVASNWLP